FTLGGHESFDPAIPHRFIYVLASITRQIYSYVEYSPTAIVLATGENWSTLTIATASPLPSRRIISAILATSPAPRPSHKIIPAVVVAVLTSAVISAPAAAIQTPQHLHEASSVIVIGAPTPASRSLCKAVITVATLASRLAHKTSSMVSLCSSRMTRTQSRLRKSKRWIRKFGPISRRITRVNHKDAQLLTPGPHYGVSRSGSRQSRRAPTTTPKKKVNVAMKRRDLPPGWCYSSRRHNTYPWLVAGY
ncbi:hypothetical protein ACLOJK_023302, partial [Asimina triloba]